MNVYDFDETVFEGDSEKRFFQYISRKKEYRHCYARYSILEFIAKKMHLCSRTYTRPLQYHFLRRVPDLDALLEEYWDYAEQFMKPWYLEAKREDDIIASGTPAFLMYPIMKRLGLKHLVATDMDCRTGVINGYFATGIHKLEYFDKQFDSSKIDKFYSDAYSDHFLADKAKEAYFIGGKNHDRFIPWKEQFKNKKENRPA